ncbi:PTS lactose/cellobiose transporter subunit IIA [Pediococcus pentosaceus]|jgi:PTS system cellobiose-specific IIA component|uniref:PTS lactose/cellobiose transporter subunit IIA n=1 Tax=Pediococcus pentosaceus TaxID=1255 RepID=UPI00265AAFCB|nr:PTS lactose/cellobiose transporter subunit IIA [Pediococcus pentosaceus]WKF71031.1 PTS lactose/cellobiose transporter subunit IIA [Pediococcus pentosaceus]
MDDLEMVCFEIISHSGQAKSCVMEAVSKSRESGKKEEIDDLINTARQELKEASTQHLKILSKFAETGKNLVNPLYVHAEDQMMGAESFLDFAIELIETNVKLAELQNKI